MNHLLKCFVIVRSAKKTFLCNLFGPKLVFSSAIIALHTAAGTRINLLLAIDLLVHHPPSIQT